MDTLEGHTGRINAIIQSENTVWSASNDKSINVWEAKAGGLKKQLLGHSGPVLSLTKTSQYIWSSSWDKTVILWDPDVCFIFNYYYNNLIDKCLYFLGFNVL